jgi:hypothetical protein
MAGLVRDDLYLVLARIGMLTYGGAGKMKIECGHMTDGVRCGAINHLSVAPETLGAVRASVPQEDALDGDQGDIQLIPGTPEYEIVVYRDADAKWNVVPTGVEIPSDASVSINARLQLDTPAVSDVIDSLAAESPDLITARMVSMTSSDARYTRKFSPPTPTVGGLKLSAEDCAFMLQLPSGLRRALLRAVIAGRSKYWDWQVHYTCHKCRAEQEVRYEPIHAFFGLGAS